MWNSYYNYLLPRTRNWPLKWFAAKFSTRSRYSGCQKRTSQVEWTAESNRFYRIDCDVRQLMWPFVSRAGLRTTRHISPDYISTTNTVEQSLLYSDSGASTETVQRMTLPCRAASSDTNDGTSHAWCAILCNWKMTSWSTAFENCRADGRSCEPIWWCSTYRDCSTASNRCYRTGRSTLMWETSFQVASQWKSANKFHIFHEKLFFWWSVCELRLPSTWIRLCFDQFASILPQLVFATSDRIPFLWMSTWNFSALSLHAHDIGWAPPWPLQNLCDAPQTLP